MKVTFYKNNSEKNVINKVLTLVDEINGSCRNEVDFVAPTLTFNMESLPEANYAYVEDFSRYYFLTEPVALRTNLWEIKFVCDVLESHKSEILAQNAIIARNEHRFNLYTNDAMFKAYQNPLIITKEFPSGFPAPTYILAVAGG